jgi:hypothetical protein
MIKTKFDNDAPLEGPLLSSWEVVREGMCGDCHQIAVRGHFNGIKMTRSTLVKTIKQRSANCLEDIQSIQLAVENLLQQMLIDIHASAMKDKEKKDALLLEQESQGD